MILPRTCRRSRPAASISSLIPDAETSAHSGQSEFAMHLCSALMSSLSLNYHKGSMLALATSCHAQISAKFYFKSMAMPPGRVMKVEN